MTAKSQSAISACMSSSFSANRKRIQRFIHVHDFGPARLQAGLVSWLVQTVGCADTPVPLLIDWSPLTKDMDILAVAAPVARGRAVPVLWVVVSKADIVRHGTRVYERALLKRLAMVVPPRNVLLVADRGFRGADLMQFIESLGFYFLIRVCDDVFVQGDAYQGLLFGYRLHHGDMLLWERIRLRKRKPVTVHLVAYRDVVKGRATAWYLATNLLAEAEVLVALYARRMWIEELFRDWKRGLLDVHKITSRRPVQAYDRLLCAVAIALLLAAWVGLFILSTAQRGFDVKFSVITIGFREISARPSVLYETGCTRKILANQVLAFGQGNPA